jgi:phosphate transport system substrate-binding protein
MLASSAHLREEAAGRREHPASPARHGAVTCSDYQNAMRAARKMALVAAVIAASACSRRARKSDFTVAGSTSVQPFAEKWAEAYQKAHPGISIHVQGGGSTAGVVAADTGAAQIGMCSRELLPAESAKLVATVVARDGIAIVVNKANPVAHLRLADVQRIYDKHIARWSELGGADKPITTITREEGSGTRGAFEELVMKGSQIAASALVQDSTGAVRQMVASDPAAIGYISLGLVDDSVKAVTIDGAEPSEATIDAGRYPIVRPFLFVTKGEPRGAAAAFIAWVNGPEGHAITRREGLLPPKR